MKEEIVSQAFRSELALLSADCYRKGWSLATSSNFSARVDESTFLITASEKDKGRLQVSDFVLVDLEGKAATAEVKPSAETPVHAALYRLDPAIGCVLHTHSLPSTVLSLAHASAGLLVLQGYEMLKALQGVTSHQHREQIPVLQNTQDLIRMAMDVNELMTRNPEIHGFLIAGHGLYTWGSGIHQAKIHLEALEFLFECELRRVK